MRDIWLTIHRSLHNENCLSINIDGKSLPIKIAANDCRYLKWDDNTTFMVQNPDKSSSYAKRARDGEQLTWVIREGSWGLIAGNRIEKT